MCRVAVAKNYDSLKTRSPSMWSGYFEGKVVCKSNHTQFSFFFFFAGFTVLSTCQSAHVYNVSNWHQIEKHLSLLRPIFVDMADIFFNAVTC